MRSRGGRSGYCWAWAIPQGHVDLFVAVVVEGCDVLVDRECCPLHPALKNGGGEGGRNVQHHAPESRAIQREVEHFGG